MSIKVMTMVFERYPAGGGEMLLALALADHAHDDGTKIFPSIKQLAEKTRQSERTVQYQLRKMEDSTWLLLQNSGNGGRNQRREYVINPFWLKGAEVAPIGKGANDDIKGANDDTKGCNPRQERVQSLHPHITVNESSLTVNESSANPKAQGDPPIAESYDPVIFNFPLNDKTNYGLRQSQIDDFASLYPSVDVMAQIRACLGWNMTNESRRKTRKGLLSHINSWLAEKQNKAPPPVRGSPPYQSRQDKQREWADQITGAANDQNRTIIDIN
jgi:hypothetical protein